MGDQKKTLYRIGTGLKLSGGNRNGGDRRLHVFTKAGLLSDAISQIIKTGAFGHTSAYNLHALNNRGMHGENSFNPFAE